MQACIHDGCIYRVVRQKREGAVAAAAAAVGCASPLEGNKGGATREIKGAPSGRRAPRLRHVFLDNLFGNINHREHRERRGAEKGKGAPPTIAIFAILREHFGVHAA